MPEKELMKIEINGYQIVEKIVKPSGNTGRVYVPVDWIGKKVKIVLIEPIDSDNSNGNDRGGGD